MHFPASVWGEWSVQIAATGRRLPRARAGRRRGAAEARAARTGAGGAAPALITAASANHRRHAPGTPRAVSLISNTVHHGRRDGRTQRGRRHRPRRYVRVGNGCTLDRRAPESGQTSARRLMRPSAARRRAARYVTLVLRALSMAAARPQWELL
ncbi:hypothetical protein EVAR_43516_1 [Eumeta japonica]|uniref:Uncharacterized protein n=1 Tax=Eumeta variegata TaxID=151549 RepID=A0A4C1YKL0_EUMVA|nr:hypothetical protein EVAR_43516_1 [Eumeta japonica]